MIRQCFQLFCLVLAIQLASAVQKYRVLHPKLDVEQRQKQISLLEEGSSCYWQTLDQSECQPRTDLICNDPGCENADLEAGTCTATGVSYVTQRSFPVDNSCYCAVIFHSFSIFFSVMVS